VLAKLTNKNQLTLPKAVLEQAGPADTYDVVCAFCSTAICWSRPCCLNGPQFAS